MEDCDSTRSRETDQLFVEQDLPVGPSTYLADQGHPTQSAVIVYYYTFQQVPGDRLLPNTYKHEIVLPRLKKDNLDASQPKNFRPVSNLPYLSKLLEKVAKTRLQEFLDEHDLMPTHQSSYRKFHRNTETALLHLYNDLLVASDQGQVSGLCLLDSSIRYCRS